MPRLVFMYIIILPTMCFDNSFVKFLFASEIIEIRLMLTPASLHISRGACPSNPFMANVLFSNIYNFCSVFGSVFISSFLS